MYMYIYIYIIYICIYIYIYIYHIFELTRISGNLLAKKKSCDVTRISSKSPSLKTLSIDYENFGTLL